MTALSRRSKRQKMIRPARLLRTRSLGFLQRLESQRRRPSLLLPRRKKQATSPKKRQPRKSGCDKKPSLKRTPRQHIPRKEAALPSPPPNIAQRKKKAATKSEIKAPASKLLKNPKKEVNELVAYSPPNNKKNAVKVQATEARASNPLKNNKEEVNASVACSHVLEKAAKAAVGTADGVDPADAPVSHVIFLKASPPLTGAGSTELDSTPILVEQLGKCIYMNTVR